MSQRSRLILAIAIVIAGVAVLARSCASTRPPTTHILIDRPGMEISDVVKAELDPARFDEALSVESIPGIYDRVRQSVLDQANSSESVRQIGQRAVEDLAEAYVERLRFIIEPDLERDYAASAQRGEPLSIEKWSQRYDGYVKSRVDSPIPAMDIDSVELMVLTHDFNGPEMQQGLRFEQGYDTSIGGRGDPLPAPSNPVAKGIPAVEIVMPMMRLDRLSKKMRPSLVGFHFAWNSGLQRWIPYESVVYHSPDAAMSPPRL